MTPPDRGAGLSDYFTLVCKAGAGAMMTSAAVMIVQVQQPLGLASV